MSKTYISNRENKGNSSIAASVASIIAENAFKKIGTLALSNGNLEEIHFLSTIGEICCSYSRSIL